MASLRILKKSIFCRSAVFEIIKMDGWAIAIVCFSQTSLNVGAKVEDRSGMGNGIMDKIHDYVRHFYAYEIT